MKKITAVEFLVMILKNSSVFEHWNTPLEITEHVDCEKYDITHLSSYLTFSGRNDVGETAKFDHCKNLETATGTFHGYVTFAFSGIQKIENLNILQSDIWNMAVSFSSCKALQIATGTYPGFVNFADSSINTIQNLHVKNPDTDGDYASLRKCHKLQTLEGWDLSKQIRIEPEKLASEINRRAALKKFHTETKIEALPFL
jgi:hypothetical protein